jgi:membrane protein YqaA with SNARE-associated domain
MGIPKPLVQVNQVFLIITVLLSWLVSPWILVLPFVVGVVALGFHYNLVMKLAKPLLKKPLKTYVQEDPQQQRFNQWIATICIGLALVGFMLQFISFMFIMSGMVLMAAALALSGYCIGCTIRYRYMMWKYQKEKGHSN